LPDIISNGIRIHYERTGGDKPPIVLCHGITDSGQCWPRLVSALQDNYDLIMLDARAHGRSEAPASGYTIENLADDVAGAILVLGLHKPAVIGHSMGAGTVAMLAARHPNLPGCMVLEDPPFREGEPTAEERAASAAAWHKSVTDRRDLPLDEMIAFTAKSNPGVKKWDKSEFLPWSEAKRKVNLNIIELLRTRA
jgi:N-formylmaleamate deformylase